MMSLVTQHRARGRCADCGFRWRWSRWQRGQAIAVGAMICPACGGKRWQIDAEIRGPWPGWRLVLGLVLWLLLFAGALIGLLLMGRRA